MYLGCCVDEWTYVFFFFLVGERGGGGEGEQDGVAFGALQDGGKGSVSGSS